MRGETKNKATRRENPKGKFELTSPAPVKVTSQRSDYGRFDCGLHFMIVRCINHLGFGGGVHDLRVAMIKNASNLSFLGRSGLSYGAIFRSPQAWSCEGLLPDCCPVIRVIWWYLYSTSAGVGICFPSFDLSGKKQNKKQLGGGPLFTVYFGCTVYFLAQASRQRTHQNSCDSATVEAKSFA